MKNKKQKFQSVAMIFLLALAISFPLRIMAATTGSDYWKTYFSDIEKKAVQKNAEKYTLSEIKEKSNGWKGLFSSFHLKNGSIKSEDIKNIDMGKINDLDDALDGKLSAGGGTLSGLLTWASGQTFNAGNLIGTYAALDGSQITGITASQTGAVPYSGATGNVDLGSRTIATTGTGTFGSLKTPIIFPSTDSTSAVQVNKADGTTNVLNVDTTNGIVGIGTTSPTAGLDVSSYRGTSDLIGIRVSGSRTNAMSHEFQSTADHPFQTSGAYATYDDYSTTSGDNNLNHLVSFQSRPTHNSTGTLVNFYGIYSTGVNNGGNITNRYGGIAGDLTGAGTITNDYGFYVAPLSKGSSKNYAFYSDGTTASYFGGNINVGAQNTAGASISQFGTGSSTTSSAVKIYNNSGNSITTYSWGSAAAGSIASGDINYANLGQILAVNQRLLIGTYGNNDMYFSTNDRSRMTIKNDGNVGIGTTSPVVKLDVDGEIKMKKESSQPFACDATHDGTTALTSTYRTCVCNGGTTAWVYTSDGTTTCVWQ